MQDDLAKMSLDELKEVAREKGLKGISKLRKSEILARLTESGEAVLPAEKNASEPKHTVKAKDNDKETEMKAENDAKVSAESGKKPERRKGSRTAIRTSHKADSSEERKEEQREEGSCESGRREGGRTAGTFRCSGESDAPGGVRGSREDRRTGSDAES